MKNAVRAISDLRFCRLPSAPDNVPFGYLKPNFPLFGTVITVYSCVVAILCIGDEIRDID